MTPTKSCWLARSALAPTKGIESTFSLLAATTRATTNMKVLRILPRHRDGNEMVGGTPQGLEVV